MSYLCCYGAVPNNLTRTLDIGRLRLRVATCLEGVVNWGRCDKAHSGKHGKH